MIENLNLGTEGETILSNEDGGETGNSVAGAESEVGNIGAKVKGKLVGETENDGARAEFGE